MSAPILFAGPSIAGLAPSLTAHVDLRGPVQQGDVYLATRDNPPVIAIVDGYFEGVPSVWHKEILWALTRHIPVLGASSMGALRAAELDVFGMLGHGAIYEGYRDGVLTDDDEVALLHGPAEMGYPALSLAMVNVRATLAAAQAAEVITNDQHDGLVAMAKARFYKDRTWESVLAEGAATAQLDDAEVAALRAWLPENEIDQKRRDAASLLAGLADTAIDAPRPAFHFEETALWRAATTSWRQRATAQQEQPDDGYRITAGLSFLDE